MILHRHGFLAITLTMAATTALSQQQTTHESPEAAVIPLFLRGMFSRLCPM